MTALTPPGWLQNAGSTHTAAQLRQYLAGSVAGRLTTSSMRARSGIVPQLGDQFVTTQTGSPSMAVLVGAGVACIAGSESGSQANYWAANDAQVTLSVTAAHATLPRIDLVVFNVRDSFYSTAFNDCQLQVVAGTPASSPVAPTPPANSITIAQIAVGAAVTSIVNANITDVRNYLAGLGGVIPVRSLSAIPASTEIIESQLLWTNDTNILYVWDGSAAKQIYPSTDLFARKTADETVNNSTTLQNDDHLFLSVAANTNYQFELSLHYNSGTTPDLKLGWTFPAGLTMTYDIYAAAGGVFLGYGQTQATTPTIDGQGSPVGAIAKGVIHVAGTPGTLQLQWAQGTLNASNSLMLTDSYFRAQIIP